MIVPIAIFVISAAALGLELVLVRALSIGHWHHFSYLVISAALLGFGAGGTVITIGSRFFTRFHNKSLWAFALGLGLTVPFVFHLCQKVPLDELQLIWDKRQFLYLFAYYLLLSAPFFCVGSCIALAFTVMTERSDVLYFYNMAGSGLGVAGIVGLMYVCSPEGLLLLVSSLAFLGALILSLRLSTRSLSVTLVCALVCLLIFGPVGPFELTINISENKSLVFYRALPESETVAVRYSPLARLDCIKAPTVRHFPGLSFAYEGSLPEQTLIINDADGISAVNNFESLTDLACYDFMTSALCYHMVDGGHVCIIGAGGGSDVAQALLLNASRVTAVEMNPQIIDLVKNRLSEFSSGLYDSRDVDIVVAEGRNFLQTTPGHYDIIGISLLDSLSASAAGLYALNESHLYTIEAVEQALRRLRPGGLLSITRMLKTPPRDSLKMLGTVTEALQKLGVTNPAEHVIMIRGWATATIVASPQPLSTLQIESANKFVRDRSFDLVHTPRIEFGDINRAHVLEEPLYYEGAQHILSGRREKFYQDYAYNIRPATDDRPYFFDFFKWRSLPLLIRAVPGQWLPFSEWGYLVMAANLLQALCASGLFILLPLWVARPVRAVRSRKLPTLTYFLMLGFAYMFLEMGYIQKMTLLIGHPVFGVAVTLVGFLFFSGCGSVISGRLVKSPQKARSLIRVAVLAIVVIGVVEIAVLMFAFGPLAGFSRPVRILLGTAITAPLAFFMGIPFPTALKQVHIHTRPLVPWAWAVNGFASVVGAVLGTFLAISLGFTALVFLALGCYLFAAIISKQICS